MKNSLGGVAHRPPSPTATLTSLQSRLVLAQAFLEKFGGDSRGEVSRNYASYLSYVETF